MGRDSQHKVPWHPFETNSINRERVLGPGKAKGAHTDQRQCPVHEETAADCIQKGRQATHANANQSRPRSAEEMQGYIASSDEDRKLHDKYHKQNVEGYDVGKDFLTKAREGTVFETSKKGDSVAAVDCHDNIWRRKRARAALDVVQRELGAVDIPDKQLWDPSFQHLPNDSNISRHTVYMYVRQNKCIGLLLVEQIIEGNKVLQPATKRPRAEDVPAKGKMSALERLREKRALQKESEAEPQSIQLAKKSSPAFLGVSRIWTSPSHRGQGIAQSLLDRALEYHNTRITHHNHSDQTVVDRSKVDSDPTSQAPSPPQHMELIIKDHVAFSQPTEVGAKLARKWTGKKYGWLVYSA
jgi:N-acetyltransferase